MSVKEFSDKYLLLSMSYQDQWVLSHMIRINDAPKAPLPRPQRESSLGQLDRLPLEVLHLMCNYMDLRSLAHLSCVSSRAYDLVQLLPTYQELLQYAPHTMAALGRTGCIRFHTLETVYETFCSENCVTCGHFGAFLFLPTCERCCYQCLKNNPVFWVTSPVLLRKFLDIGQDRIKELPIMRGLPGIYLVGEQGYVSYKRPLNLVSVKAAGALAMEIYGSLENMQDKQNSGPVRRDWMERDYLLWALRSSVQFQSSSILYREAGLPKDKYGGLGAVPMPSLHSGEPDPGLWCHGCEAIFHELSPFDEDELAKVFEANFDGETPEDPREPEIFLALQHRAWSKSEFLKHMRKCYGVSKLIAGEWHGEVGAWI